MSAGDTLLVSILIRSMDRPTLDRAIDSAARQTCVPRNKSLRENLDLIRARVKSAKADHVAH